MLSSTSSLLGGFHSPAGGRVCSPVGVEAPRSFSELWHEIGPTGVLPLRKKPLSIPLQELSTAKCFVVSPVI